eukprot:CAMPEP_0176467854 /NCGR_PEP_ID=MMETSP0127-20121128/38693_1 /TAXON_ID=938130 /ORGANISM="Platyophrya macrostoma, Strain WH" /LENGTH=497 /DNA_ID=CAMNT_0017861207 /DNA_START=37 /DNA_END=1529 /DNA_ORIENTATION=+
MATRVNPDLVDGGAALEVIDYVVDLDRAVQSKDISLAQLCDKRFNEVGREAGLGFDKKTKQYHAWPAADSKAITELQLDTDNEVPVPDRSVTFQSAGRAWAAFQDALRLIASDDVVFDLPNSFLWDIFDEMVYQITVVYKKRMTRRKEIRVDWSVQNVIETLEKFVEKIGIDDELQQVQSGSLQPEALLAPSKHHMQVAAGLFAIIALMRIDVLLGDFEGALRRLERLGIPLLGRRYFTGENIEGGAAAHISLYFHVGFCYLMLRRYVDAASFFRTCIMAKSYRRYSERTQTDAAYLYNVASILGGFGAEDVSNTVDERQRATFEDDVRELAAGQHDRFREVFSRSAPRFLSIPIGGSYGEGAADEAFDMQTKAFMREVMQLMDIIAIRSYFHVYRTISTQKIDALLQSNASQEHVDGHAALIAMKHKSKQLVHDGQSCNLLAGTYKSTAQVELAIEGDSVQLVPVNFGVPLEIRLANSIAEFSADSRERISTDRLS